MTTQVEILTEELRRYTPRDLGEMKRQEALWYARKILRDRGDPRSLRIAWRIEMGASGIILTQIDQVI